MSELDWDGLEGAANEAQTFLPRAQRLLDADTLPVEDAIEGFLPADIALISGQDGVFKTLAALAIAGAVSAGASPFDAFPAAAPRRVLIVSEEDGVDVLANRVLALAQGHGWDVEVVRKHLYVLALEGIELDTDRGAAVLMANVDVIEPALIVFDPLASLIAGEESSNSDARRAIALWRRFVSQGRAVVVVAHEGKPPIDGGASRGPRGASAFRAASRAHYVVTRSDLTVTLTCGKLSRRLPPPPVELVVAIATDPGNGAMWSTATMSAPGQGSGSWQIRTQKALSPSERKALATLQAFHGESLSFSAWASRSAVPESTLALAQKHLAAAGYIEKKATGKAVAGRPGFSYEITLPGLAVLAEAGRDDPKTPRLQSDSIADSIEPQTPRLQPGSIADSMEPADARLQDSNPPFRGVSLSPSTHAGAPA